MPFKLNQNRRHHVPKQRHKVTNWPAYDASLRQRGSLTVWFTDEAIAAWTAEPRTTRGGQRIERGKFEELARAAQKNCPVSKVLNAEITMNFTLV